MIKIKVPGYPDIPLISYYQHWEKLYSDSEPQTKKWFVDNVQPEWTIYDCGANIGQYSILFSQLAYRGIVHAFEPTTTNAMLRDNIIHNNTGNVWIHHYAVGSLSGKFEVPIYRLWGYPPEIRKYDFITIDDFVQIWDRPDCIKIDVDSFDFEVLLGAEKTLEMYNPWIVVELNDALLLRGHSPARAFKWLLDHGYKNYTRLDEENYAMRRE